MKTLVELVNNYNKNFAGYEIWKLSDFRNRRKTLDELIKDAVWGILPDLKRDSLVENIVFSFNSSYFKGSSA